MKRAPANANRHERPDDANAFFPDTIGSGERLAATADAEFFGEEYIASALNGGSVNEDAADEVGDAEEGGPFLMLDDEARLPDDGDDLKLERGGDEAVTPAVDRGASWVSKHA